MILANLRHEGLHVPPRESIARLYSLCVLLGLQKESLLTALCKQVLLKQRTPIYRMVFARGALLHETESA